VASGGAGGMASGGAGGAGAGGSGAGGAGGSASAAQSVYLLGDFVTNNVEQAGRIAYPGPLREALPLDGFGGGDVRALAVSPDGATIAVAGRLASGMFALSIYAANGLGPATNLLTASDSAIDYRDLSFSPDGEWIAFRSDATANSAHELWVIPSNGGQAKRVSQPVVGMSDVHRFAWQPIGAGASRYLAYVGDVATDKVDGLWTVEITTASPQPLNLVPEAADGYDVVGGVEFDAAGLVYFRANFADDGLYRIYRASVDGVRREQVPGTLLSHGSGEAQVGSFGLSADKTQLAFTAEAPTAHDYQVYVQSLADGALRRVSESATPVPVAGDRGPLFFRPILWAPDASKLAVIADWPVAGVDNDNRRAAFVLSLAEGADPGQTRLLLAPASNQAVEQLEFSADSARLFIRGDLLNNNQGEVFSTSDFMASDQDAAALVEVDLDGNRDVFELIPTHR